MELNLMEMDLVKMDLIELAPESVVMASEVFHHVFAVSLMCSLLHPTLNLEYFKSSSCREPPVNQL